MRSTGSISVSLRRSFFQLVDQFWWMKFLMWEKRSELEGNIDLNMVGLRAACLAALSIFSFLGIPLGPGAQMKTIGIKAVPHVSRRMCIRGTRGWEAVG